MLHKLGYTIGECSQCHKQIHEDERYDGENELCEACVDAWEKEQKAYWYPLWLGEKKAGLIK